MIPSNHARQTALFPHNRAIMNPEETEHGAEHTHDELGRLKALLSRHGLRAALWIGIVALAVATPMTYKNYRADKAAHASALLGSARSVQDLESLVENYSSTKVAPLAELRLAKAFFSGGRYDMALSKYNAFLESFPEHDFVPVAEMGKLHCFEALGRYEQAMRGFEQFLRDNPEHYLTPQAHLGEARCLNTLGMHSQAESRLEDYLATNPARGWASRAQELLDFIEKDREAKKKRFEDNASQES